MKMIEQTTTYQIWHDTKADEYAVYGLYNSGDPRWVPSLGMAREIAAGLIYDPMAR